MEKRTRTLLDKSFSTVGIMAIVLMAVSLIVLLYVCFNQPALFEKSHIGSPGFSGGAVAVAAVELTLVVDALGKSPLFKETGAVEIPG